MISSLAMRKKKNQKVDNVSQLFATQISNSNSSNSNNNSDVSQELSDEENLPMLDNVSQLFATQSSNSNSQNPSKNMRSKPNMSNQSKAEEEEDDQTANNNDVEEEKQDLEKDLEKDLDEDDVDVELNPDKDATEDEDEEDENEEEEEEEDDDDDEEEEEEEDEEEEEEEDEDDNGDVAEEDEDDNDDVVARVIEYGNQFSRRIREARIRRMKTATYLWSSEFVIDDELPRIIDYGFVVTEADTATHPNQHNQAAILLLIDGDCEGYVRYDEIDYSGGESEGDYIIPGTSPYKTAKKVKGQSGEFIGVRVLGARRPQFSF
jgi:hypothetical protein